MNILVTGSSGYIGTRLAVLVREAFPNATVLTCDTKQRQDYGMLHGNAYDIVFHLGAISTIMDSFERADEMMANNALNLIPFFQNNAVGKIVFSSTGAIYGNMTHPMREDEAKWMDCLAPYAQTKYVAEGIIRRMCPNHVIARFGNVFGGDYGPREEWLAPTHFMRDDPIVLYGGTQIRDFVNVDVVCKALIDAGRRPDVVGTFNIANGEGVRLEDVAKLFSKERRVPIVYKEHRQGDAVYVVLDVTKARKAGLLPKETPVNDYRS
jgi:nucleoside-diphosphate-sugar epimerase